ncbi:MAG: ABC transporter permease [Clostridia bacterium]|nr:ABC transporter permease [Butyrivibrio sp.]MBQ7548049.1 ABC transporter permease [Clostridia bacterium]
MLSTILSWITRAILFGVVIMFGAMGETLTEKSGNMNLGTPGIMCIGGAFGFGCTYLYEMNTDTPNAFLSIFIAVFCAFFFSFLAGLLFCLLTTTLRANQNVTGLAMTIFGSGLAKFFGMFIIPEGVVTVKATFANSLFSKRMPIDFGTGKVATIIEEVFFGHGFMLYVAIAIAIVLAIFLKRTRTGLNLRAVGENPATADAAGINVNKYKYLATSVGAGIAGLGGAYYILDYNYGGWSTGAAGGIQALGWLAVALVIFAIWRPLNLIWGSFLFGLCYWLYNYIGVFGVRMTSAQSALLEAIPYVVTIIVLIISSIHKKRENQPPAALGLSYFREER